MGVNVSVVYKLDQAIGVSSVFSGGHLGGFTFWLVLGVMSMVVWGFSIIYLSSSVYFKHYALFYWGFVTSMMVMLTVSLGGMGDLWYMTGVVVWIMLLLVSFTKSAQFPFMSWLPAAMAAFLGLGGWTVFLSKVVLKVLSSGIINRLWMVWLSMVRTPGGVFQCGSMWGFFVSCSSQLGYKGCHGSDIWDMSSHSSSSDLLLEGEEYVNGFSAIRRKSVETDTSYWMANRLSSDVATHLWVERACWHMRSYAPGRLWLLEPTSFEKVSWWFSTWSV